MLHDLLICLCVGKNCTKSAYVLESLLRKLDKICVVLSFSQNRWKTMAVISLVFYVEFSNKYIFGIKNPIILIYAWTPPHPAPIRSTYIGQSFWNCAFAVFENPTNGDQDLYELEHFGWQMDASHIGLANKECYDLQIMQPKEILSFKKVEKEFS